jgi:hypothetical protein
MRTLRAHFDGKVLVPEEPVDLPLGRSLKFGLLDEEPELTEPELTRGSPAAIRAAMKDSPHFTETEIAAFNEAIESEKRPARSEGIFDE